MKVLAYSGEESAMLAFPDAQLYKDNPPQTDFYDGVYLENLLQQMLRREVVPGLRIFWNSLVVGGKIVIVVPSLEWACREVGTKDDPSPLAYLSIYGDDENPHLSGYTIMYLRKVCESVGFVTDTCYAQDYNVMINDTQHRGRSNVYTGFKRETSPESAIE